jgi:2-formylbenzoate dehydrogenase
VVEAKLGGNWSLLLGGQLTRAVGGNSYLISSPSTGEPLAKVPAADGHDVQIAVDAAVTAQREWRRTPVRARAEVLVAIAAVVRDNADEFSRLDALDSGNPVAAMYRDVMEAATALEQVASWADQLSGTSPASDFEHLHYTLREPFGIVGRIVPYNHPIMFAASKIAAPLMAGNAVILKAPDQTPLSALRLGELLVDIVPAGLLSILTGHGYEVGAELVAHPGVRRIAFTGSLQTGQTVLRTAAESGIKSVTLELGGKNPMIILSDADLDAAGAGVVAGMNFAWTAGQSCGSTSRLLVHDSIADDIIERVAEGIRALRVGDPLDESTEMGCLVSQEHRQRVRSYIDRGDAAGLSRIDGQQKIDDRGAFIAPTAFLDVPADSVLAREEIFGPVLAVTRFSDEADALRIANGTEYGLTASIWTKDLGRAHRLARSVEAGYVWVNTASQHFAGLPFGGVKNSGLGREESADELHSYTETKSVTIRVNN